MRRVALLAVLVLAGCSSAGPEPAVTAAPDPSPSVTVTPSEGPASAPGRIGDVTVSLGEVDVPRADLVSTEVPDGWSVARVRVEAVNGGTVPVPLERDVQRLVAFSGPERSGLEVALGWAGDDRDPDLGEVLRWPSGPLGPTRIPAGGSVTLVGSWLVPADAGHVAVQVLLPGGAWTFTGVRVRR